MPRQSTPPAKPWRPKSRPMTHRVYRAWVRGGSDLVAGQKMSKRDKPQRLPNPSVSNGLW